MCIECYSKLNQPTSVEFTNKMYIQVGDIHGAGFILFIRTCSLEFSRVSNLTARVPQFRLQNSHKVAPYGSLFYHIDLDSPHKRNNRTRAQRT